MFFEQICSLNYFKITRMNQLSTLELVNEQGLLVFEDTGTYLTKKDIMKFIESVKKGDTTISSKMQVYNLLKIYEVYPRIIEEHLNGILQYYKPINECKNITTIGLEELSDFILVKIPYTNDKWCLEKGASDNNYNPFSGKTLTNKTPTEFLLFMKEVCNENLTRLQKSRTRKTRSRMDYHSGSSRSSDSNSLSKRLSKTTQLTLHPHNTSRRTRRAGETYCQVLSEHTKRFLDYWTTEIYTVGKTFVQIPYNVVYELVPTRPCKPIKVRRGMSWMSENDELFTSFMKNVKSDLTGHIVFTTFASFSHERVYAQMFTSKKFYCIIETTVDYNDVIFDMDRVCNLGYKSKYAEAEILVTPGKYKFTIIEHNLPGLRQRGKLRIVPTLTAIAETTGEVKQNLIKRYLETYFNNKKKLSLLVQYYTELKLDLETTAHLVIDDFENMKYIHGNDVDAVNNFIERYHNEGVGEKMEIDDDIPTGKSKDKFPQSLDELEVVKSLGGTTGAVLVKDKSNRLFVRKKGNNAEHLLEEDTADRLYRALNINVPNSKLYKDTDGRPVKIAEFIQGTTLANAVDSAKHENTLNQLRWNFIVDALLGNWDVIGFRQDNILIDTSGTPWRIDNGGSLRFRAKGSRKNLEDWGPEVKELKTMRDAKLNSSAAKIFGSLTEEDLKQQFFNFKSKKDKLLAAAPEELRDTFSVRRGWVNDDFKTKARWA